MEAHVHHRRRAGAHAAAARCQARRAAMSTRPRPRSTPSTQMATNLGVGVDRHPLGLLPLHGDRRARGALAGAVLDDQLHAISSSRWRRSSRARTSPMAAALGIPNEDAQSFVFDATTLFERDKFSGYDRIEGGTRANVGLRYSGSLRQWLDAPTRSSASPTSWPARTPSPRPTSSMSAPIPAWRPTTSDYVGLVGFTTPIGLSASVSGRFDEQTFEVRRAEVEGRLFRRRRSRCRANYAFIQAQPLYGFTDDRHEVTLGASAQLARELARLRLRHLRSRTAACWSTTSIGFAYDDECFTYHDDAIRNARHRSTTKYDRRTSASTSRSARSAISALDSNGIDYGQPRSTTPGSAVTSFRRIDAAMQTASCHSQMSDWRSDRMAFDEEDTLLSAGIAAAHRGARLCDAPCLRGRRRSASEIKYVVNNMPVTSYDIQRRAAFLKLQRTKGNQQMAAEEMIDQTLRAAEIEAPQHPHLRRRRSTHAYAALCRAPTRCRPSRLDQVLTQAGVTQGAFQGVHPRPDGLEPGAVSARYRRDRAARMSEQDAVQRMLQQGGDKPIAPNTCCSRSSSSCRRPSAAPRSASASARPRPCARASTAATPRANSPRA